MRKRLALLLSMSAAAVAEGPPAVVPEISGHLENAAIREASGLAHSARQADVFWVVNDNGSKKIVHAIDASGKRLGEFRLRKSKNRDWEDLAAFRLDGDAILMVADIGDNDAVHPHGTLYFVKEPRPRKKDREKLDWRIDFSYPDGPRDAESAAVDLAGKRVLILSKRDLPPRLYAVPLATDDASVAATYLGNVNSLRRPARRELQFAVASDIWNWQPVGMDISANGEAAVILTYEAVYYYRRQPRQSWPDVLNGKPARVSLGNFEEAEAVAFGNNDQTVFVTGENRHAPILKIVFPQKDIP